MGKINATTGGDPEPGAERSVMPPVGRLDTDPTKVSLPLRGPLRESPAAVLARAGAEAFPGTPNPSGALAEAQLGSALDRIQLGVFDHLVAAWLRSQDPQTTATVASWVRRAWLDGVEVGRTEQVDEAPTVAAVRAQLADAEDRLSKTRTAIRELHATLMTLQNERNQARSGLARLAAAADEWRPVVEDWRGVVSSAGEPAAALLAAIDEATGGAR